MCYAKPGPRCSGHVKKDVQRNVESYQNDPSEKNYEKLQVSTLERAGQMKFPPHQDKLADEANVSRAWVRDVHALESKINDYRSQNHKMLSAAENRAEFVADVEQRIKVARERGLADIRQRHGCTVEEERGRFVALGRAEYATIQEGEKFQRKLKAEEEALRPRRAAIAAMSASRNKPAGQAAAATAYLKTLDNQEMSNLSARSGVDPLVLKNLKSGDPVAMEELAQKHPLAVHALHDDSVEHTPGEYGTNNPAQITPKEVWSEDRVKAHGGLSVQSASTVHKNGDGRSYNVTQYKGNPIFSKHFDRGRNPIGHKATSVSVITPVEKPNGPTKVMVSSNEGVPIVHHFQSRAAANLWVGESTILAHREHQKENAEEISPLRKLVREAKEIRDARRAPAIGNPHA